MNEKTSHPRLGAPPQRALAAAGITCLEDLTKWREADIARLHGIGPNAMRPLDQAMKERGLQYSPRA